MAIDPVTLTVIYNSLQHVCNEMDLAVERAAFCPVVSEARDRANGIYRASDGEMVAQGETSLPIFVGTMQYCVQNSMRAIPVLQPGDVIMTNDPYISGTHLMDVKLVKPFFYDGELVAVLGDTAHWTDVGGALPGGFNPAATEVIQEGIRIPPLLLVCEGQLQHSVLELLLANVRIPGDRLGDLKAQLAAFNVGEQRLTELFDRYGTATMVEAMDELNDRSEEHMRVLLDAIPDGAYSFDAYLDNDGIGFEPLRVQIEIRVNGSNLLFDFSGSSAPTAGPFNASYVSTASAVHLAMKHIFPEVPVNGGCFRPLEIHAPDDTFLNASYPRAVSGCATEVTMRVVDAVFGALADQLPSRIPAACFGSICCFTIGGRDPATGREYVMFSFSGGGYGGSVESDGLTNGCAPISIARTTPVEVLEAYYPVMYEKYGIHEGSAGAGKTRGGYGLDVQVRLLRGEATSNVLADRRDFVPFGHRGGMDAAGTDVFYELDGVRWRPDHGTKARDVRMRAGDALRIASPGGGGLGEPRERNREAVQRDVQQGLLSPEAAFDLYGFKAPSEGGPNVQ